MDWLKEQLVSLNDQSYENLELLVLDDCSTEVPFEEIKDCVEACITRFPLEIHRNGQNLGSTKAFEKLTVLARGRYIAYCDQDDVWHKDRIEAGINTLEASAGIFVFSDVKIINSNGEKIADSITKVRKHHKFYHGSGLSEKLLFKNFAIGCTIVIDAAEAKKAIPFCPFMVHDHWLALHSSVHGEILFLRKPYVNYRIHESNQTLMLAGVADKDSYLDKRIEEALSKFIWLKERFAENRKLSDTIIQAIEWLTARRDNFNKKGSSVRVIWKYRRFGFLTSLFEIAAPRLPEKVFLFFIKMVRKNII
jgi:glycosyltransferase involved in cell wall biosynthesis